MQATARNIPAHARPQRKRAIRGTALARPVQDDPDPRRGMGMGCLVGTRRRVFPDLCQLLDADRKSHQASDEYLVSVCEN